MISANRQDNECRTAGGFGLKCWDRCQCPWETEV